MSKVSITPPPGVVRNGTPSNTPGRWWDASLMRWVGHALQPIGGWRSINAATFASPIREMLVWHANDGKAWAAVGLDNGDVWAYDFSLQAKYLLTSAFSDLEPPGAVSGYGIADFGEDLSGTPRTDIGTAPGDGAIMGDWFSFANFGQDLLFLCTNDGRLHHWSPSAPSTPATVVAGAPTGNIGVLVSDQRHVFLFGAGGDPRAVKWSSQESYTDWTPSTTNTAGGYTVASSAGIIMGLNVREGVLVLCETDVHLLRYLGAPYVYSIQKAGEACGPVGPKAAITVANATAWMGRAGFFVWSGQVAPLPCDVGDFVFSHSNTPTLTRSFVHASPNFPEIWWFYPGEGGDECSRYLIWNYSANWWSIGAMLRTAADVVGPNDPPLLAGPNGSGGSVIYQHEFGWLANGAPRTGLVFAESSAFAIGEGDQIMHGKAIITDVARAFDAVQFRLFTAYQPDGQETAHGPFSPATRGDGKVDARFSARQVRLRIEAARDIDIMFGRTRLDVTPGGMR